jgi:hypothetical protein
MPIVLGKPHPFLKTNTGYERDTIKYYINILSEHQKERERRVYFLVF